MCFVIDTKDPQKNKSESGVERREMTDSSVKSVFIAVALFAAAGLCEIAGGWFVWKWRKADWSWGFFVLGSLILIGYGVIPTFQDQVFGRTYAAYGGFFIILSLLWGWALDGDRPDKWDVTGAAIALAGVCVVMFMPRKEHVTVSMSPTPSA
ncbi:small multidrug resistance family-3 protein [Marchantia polymorpha subsp. ruderalis]